jgi:hypothetical protein
MKNINGIAAMAAAALLAGGVAEANTFAVGAKAGTKGLGLEGTLQLTRAVNLRGGYYSYDFGADLDETDVEYDGDLRLRNAALFADWHPFEGRFRLSTGGIHTRNEFRGSANGLVRFADTRIPAQLDARAGWSGVKPYVGIGFGNAVLPATWSFSFDLGVMFTGSPAVRVEGNAADPALVAAFQDEIDREEAALREELSSYKYFPVVSIGLAYSF